MTCRDTLEKAIELYGADSQLNVAIEEMSELTKEICKYKRGANNHTEIVEEMADVYVMLWQMQMMFNVTDNEIEHIMRKKIDRLKERLYGGD